ncbi:MAG TPA: CPBP family intramembrane metalloprotease [Lacipirellulaceae bacterium]|nr:CPBP family intramembrane metalloprotease [Lacipirellulaceae bacterium]
MDVAPLADPPWRPRDAAMIAVALVLPSAITYAYFFRAGDESASVQGAVYGTLKTLQFLLPVVWVLAVQRARLQWRPAAGRGVALGLAFGVAVAAGALAVYAVALRGSPVLAEALPQMRAKVAGFGIDQPGKFLALAAFYSLIHSLLEEYYWRWFVFGQLRRRAPLSTAVALSSLGFMAHHVLVLGKYFGFAHWATYVLSACVALGGAYWAWLYDRSRSLAGPWLSHAIVDAAIFLIGYDLVRAQWAG